MHRARFACFLSQGRCRSALLMLGLIGLLGTAGNSPATAAEGFSAEIDRLIAAGTPDYQQHAAPLADDAEFLRRVTLDLTGLLPTTAEARAFLADSAPDKRVQLVDRLFASPAYARHMQRRFDVIFMRRLPGKNVAADEWQTFLRDSFAENKPYDQLVREILAADGTDLKNRGPARFYLDRNGDVDAITRDVGRLFLGADLECAQCHDHPEVADFKQADYYGVAAFLIRGFVFTDPKAKKTMMAEKGVGEVSFESVFEVRDKVSKGPKSTPPRVFGGPPLEEPKFKKGEEYKVKPAKNVRPVPKFSRLEKLPEFIVGEKNERFARTAANRLWDLMMGRGLVEPLDFDHEFNPPSHPELLDRLTEELVAHGYDVKWMLRQIVLSDTYQRSSRLPEDSPVPPLPESAFGQALLKPLMPAQFAWAILEATGEAEVHRNALGDKLTEPALVARLAGTENRFIKLFGGEPGSPPEKFESNIEQVLFLSNDPLIHALIRRKTGNLADRLLKLPEDQDAEIAEELFLSTLTRPPSPDDQREVAAMLKGRTGDDRRVAIEELIWALVTSAEFRFNH